MSLVTVCMASVLVVLVAIKLKKMNAEYSTLLSIGACLFIVSFIIGRLGFHRPHHRIHQYQYGVYIDPA